MRRIGLLLSALWLVPTLLASGQPRPVELAEPFPAIRFAQPVDVQHAGDGSGRLFVVEREGTIRVVAGDGANEAPLFLDLRDRVEHGGGEEGLLGLAFHPDYASNGYLFVYYTRYGPRRSVVVRFEVDPDDPNRADPESEAVILEVEQPYSNHNGGQLRFGPDAYLYIALGDGGSAGDPDENGQDLSTLLGSLLRIDVDGREGDRAYAIPPDNPFVGAQCGPAGCREEIYAYGLRNPWRFSFDRATGALWAADVGQNRYEEIDLIEPGGNYGWDEREGLHCFEPATGCRSDGLVAPVWEYAHSQGRSVTGGFVYRGAAIPALAGRYVYGDFTSGRIWALEVQDGVAVENTELFDTNLNITTFGEDEAGELVVADGGGRLYRLERAEGTGREETPRLAARLDPPFPQPSAGRATLGYELAAPGVVELAVFDVQGRRVRTLMQAAQAAGQKVATWDGHDDGGRRVTGGLYLVRLSVDGQVVATQRLVRVPAP